MTQPEALLLADLWEKHSHGYARTPEARTAAELRRLSAVEAQRDALLEALRWIADRCPVHLSDYPLHNIHKEMSHDAGARARAAIKAVEGEKT